MAKNNNKGKNQKAKKSEFFLTRMFKSIVSFFKGVSAELKKVVWPTKDELVQYTGIVFVIVAILTVFIWGFDTVLGFLKGLL